MSNLGKISNFSPWLDESTKPRWYIPSSTTPGNRNGVSRVSPAKMDRKIYQDDGKSLKDVGFRFLIIIVILGYEVHLLSTLLGALTAIPVSSFFTEIPFSDLTSLYRNFFEIISILWMLSSNLFYSNFCLSSLACMSNKLIKLYNSE